MKIHAFSAAIMLILCSLNNDAVFAQGRGSHHHRGFPRGGHPRIPSGIHGSRHHGHSGWGFYFGVPFPFYSSPYYNYPYYPPSYPPAIITIPQSPPTYIQQPPATDQAYPPGYWYYCSDPQGYYPYIKECPTGWQQVEPTPPPPPPSPTPSQP